MQQHRLTESACRALERAAILADAAGYSQVEPICLLWGVMREESRASEILARLDISADVFLVDAPPESCGNSIDESMLPMQRDVDPLPHSPGLSEVILQARQLGDMAGRHTAVGSEHLLWGLAVVDSPVRKLLQAHGVEESFLAEQVDAASGISTVPLDADIHLAIREQTATDRVDCSRILDAAANRAREGLRVVEDFVRFTLDDAHLTRLLKQCRHDLAATMERFDTAGLLTSRNTLEDVGTTVATSAESMRRSPLDVAQANFKRVEEALRTLEEFGKVLSPDTAGRIEQLRYRLYTLEKATLGTHSARQRLDGVRLYLLATDRVCHHGLGPAVREATANGVGIVQLREKDLTDRQLINQARRVREWTREAGALFIMNDRADLAVLTDADGVHVGQEELSVREARRIVGPDRLIGVSTHSIEQARQAVLDGADYIGVGPVFPSTTKRFDDYAGLELVRQVAAEISLPWFSIGGISLENVSEVIEAGATRVAVSGAICGAERPGEAARELTNAIADLSHRDD